MGGGIVALQISEKPKRTRLYLTFRNSTKESVETALKSLKTNSAPGPDGMTSELLTKCAFVRVNL